MGAYRTVAVCACFPTGDDDRALARGRDALGDEAFQVTRSTPAEALLDVVRPEGADLLVDGHRGLDGVEGGSPGSVPADATRRSEVDALVVDTTG